MNNERALTILLEPHLSEKTSQTGGAYQVHGFKVLKNATKPEIKEAVESLFSVKVRSVRTSNVKSKPARYGRTQGRHRGWKKAYVMLDMNQSIDLGGA